MEGNSRVLTFFSPDKKKTASKNKAMKIIEQARRAGMKDGKTVLNMNLEVNLNGIGVSLVSKLTDKRTKRKERKEIIYLVAKGNPAQVLGL